MIDDLCLNRNNPQVALWFENVGPEETYRQYVLHNSTLPDWNTVSSRVSFKDAREFLSTLIPASQYKYERLNAMLVNLPIGTQAAFWRNTFYFKDAVSKGELGEEAFHAVVSTILTNDERTEFYSVGEQYIKNKGKNLATLVNSAVNSTPQTYLSLTTEQRRERVIEEHVAEEFRHWFNKEHNLPKSLGDKVGKFFQDLFRTIMKLFSTSASHRFYFDSLFQDIKDGKYRDAHVNFDENVTPTTYLVSGVNSTGATEIVGEAESEQVLRNLVANYFLLSADSVDTDENIKKEVFSRAQSYYNTENKVIASALVPTITAMDEETGDDIDIDNEDYKSLVEEFEKRIAVVKPFMFDLIESDQGDESNDENADRQGGDGLGHSDSSSANENGFDSISDWLKTYFKTVSTSTTVTTSDGKSFEFAQAVDQNKIYYGVARALNNSRNDFERLIKLITYAQSSGNNAANALLNKLVRDASGKADVESIINSIKKDYLQEYRYNKDGSIINRYFDGSRSYILQNVLKGFDLWSRTTMFQTISPETGNTITSNANVNNAVKNQMGKWQTQSVTNYVTRNLAELKGLRTDLFALSDSFSQDLAKAVEVNKDILEKTLGVSVSEGAMRWLLVNKAFATTPEGDINLDDNEKLQYRAFESEIKSYGAREAIESILINIKNFSGDINTLYEDEGVSGRLNTLAKINALFDESVFESSYKNAEGKTIYGFQWKTYDLEFVANLQDEKFTDSMLNNGIVSYRKDKNGNDVYLTEGKEFLEKNWFLRQMYTKDVNGKYVKNPDAALNKILPYMKLESLDGLRQVADEGEGREGEGVTFSNMLTKDFDQFRLNAAVNRVVKVSVMENGKSVAYELYPHFIANLEAKRTADFVYLPELRQKITENGTLSDKGVAIIKEEIRKEYERISRVHSEISIGITNNIELLKFNKDNVAKLDSTVLRKMLNKDVYEKYHTGAVRRELIPSESEGVQEYRYVFHGARALEFTDAIKGVLPKAYMSRELATAAVSGQSFNDFWEDQSLTDMMKDHWKNVIFQEHYDKMEKDGIVPLLDSRWKDGIHLNREKFEKFIVSSFINTLAFNQMMHGDSALILKNDGADFAKRKGGANAAIQSAETYLVAPLLGIHKVKNKVTYVTANEMQSVVAYDPGAWKKDKNGDDMFEKNTMDQADAQNYATTDYKRNLLWSRGKLDKFLANVLDDLELGLPLTPTQQAKMVKEASFLNVDKTVAYNGIQYMKKSDFMLTKEFTSVLTSDARAQLSTLDTYSAEARAIRMDENNWVARPDTKFHHTLRQNMEGWRRDEDGILYKPLNDNKEETGRYDLYMPTSASKMLNVNVFNPATGWNNIDDSIMQIDAKNYGLQLENPAGKTHIIDPSQMIEIIFNEQQDEVKVLWKGEEKTVGNLGELYQDYLARRDNSTFDMAYNEIFDEKGEFDATNFFPKMVSSLIASGADPQVIQLFKLNDKGQPEFNANMGITKEKFTNQIFAQFTKAVLQHKVAGDALAHVSSYGIRPLKKIIPIVVNGKQEFTWEVVKRDTIEYNRVSENNNYVDLRLEETTPDKGVIYDPTIETDQLRRTLADMYASGRMYFTDELRHLKPRYQLTDELTEQGQVAKGIIAYYSESFIPASKVDDQVPKEHNKWSFGVRIPSQDKHSAVNVEWVDAMPLYYGNTISTAKEIVTISGSDFDIDKLFIHKPELYKLGKQYFQYGEGDKWTEYMAYLKEHNHSFSAKYKSEFKKFVQDDMLFDDVYNGVRDQKRYLQETLDAGNVADTQGVLDHIKKLQVQEDLMFEEYESRGSVRERFEKEVVPGILRDMRLPVDISKWDNPYTLNNELLALKQIALTNEGTLLPVNGTEATYKTAATMDALKRLAKLPMFTREDGTSVFGTTDNLPNHIFAKHSVVHTKNSVGKANINPYVNGNLGLIIAVRAGFTINPDFRIEINGHKITGFGPLSADGQRAFDTISTLISAATDEAKEQLNAQYNLNLEGAAIVKTMVSLGFPLDTSIGFVNQPIVQQYLKLKQERIQTVYLEDEYEFKSDEDIITELVGSLEGAYEGTYGNDELGATLTGKELKEDRKAFDKRILKDLDVINHVNSQLGLLTRFLKVKKGFVGGLTQLDQLNDAIVELGLGPDVDPATFSENQPMNTNEMFTMRDRIPQVINVIENIVPAMNNVANKLLLDRNSGLQTLKASVLGQFKNGNAKTQGNIVKDIESYLYTRLFQEQTGSEYADLMTTNLYRKSPDKSWSTVAETLLDLKREVKRISKEGAKTKDERILFNLVGTSILKRLTSRTVKEKVFKPGERMQTVENDELRLDTFAKLSLEEQDTLIASYSNMIRNLSHLSDDYIQFKDLPKQIFAYWMMKDGFQSKFGSVSKLFPVYMFKDHSVSLDRALNGKSNIFNSLRGATLLNAHVKDVVSRIAKSGLNRKLLKSFYVPVDKNVALLNGDYNVFFNLLDKKNLDTKKRMLSNYPFGYVVVNDELSINSIPLYLKSKQQSAGTEEEFFGGGAKPKAITLELYEISYKDGKSVITDFDFVSKVYSEAGNVISVKYRPMEVHFNKFQSNMTLDTNYTPAIASVDDKIELAKPISAPEVLPVVEELRDPGDDVTNEIEATEEEFPSVIKTFKHWGAEYTIETKNGVGVDVLTYLGNPYKGVGKKKRAILDAYNEDPNTDIQDRSVKNYVEQTNEIEPSLVIPEAIVKPTFTFPDGVKITTDFELSDEQQELMTSLYNWYNGENSGDPDFKNMYIVQGSAGSGKSSTIGYFLKYMVQTRRVSGSQIGLSSPSHKANKVLYKFVSGLTLDSGRPVFEQGPLGYRNGVFTTQAAFGVKVDYNAGGGVSVGGMKGAQRGYSKLAGQNARKRIWIIDEVSMLSEQPTKMKSVIESLKHYANDEDIKIIMMGDNKQLKGVDTGTLSPLFELVPNSSVLVKEQRQKTGNPILETLLPIKITIDSKSKGNPLALKEGKYNTETGKGLVYHDNIPVALKDLFKTDEYKDNREYVKIIARSNARVSAYNSLIRNHIFKNPALYEVGDTLMGYQQRGIDNAIFNGQEYKVENVEFDQTVSFEQLLKEAPTGGEEIALPIDTIREYFGQFDMNVHRLVVRENRPLFDNSPIKVNIVTFKDAEDVQNFVNYSNGIKKIDTKLKNLYAERNAIYSSNLAPGVKYEKANEVSNQIKFLVSVVGVANSVVQVHNTIYRSETGGFITDAQVTDEIKSKFGDNFNVIEEEKAKRQYMEKTIDYGYAVTNTKAQGSTYQNVIVDLESIEGKNDYWFTKDADDALRNLYVAVSRSSGVAHLITRDKFTNTEQVEEDKNGCKPSI